MLSAQSTTAPGPDISVLFAHAADEDLKNLVIPCLKGFREISTAENGGEALRLYHAKPSSIVVASLDLGDMTGFDLSARIRAITPEALIVLIGREQGVSAYKEAMASGAVHYVAMDQTAHETLKAAINAEYSVCESRWAHRQTAAACRLQAEALRTVRFPIALLSAGGRLVSVNHAFRNLVNATDDNGCVTLSAALEAIPTVEPATGWNSLLQAAAQGAEWSGNVVCKGMNGVKLYIRATLSHFEAEKTGSGYNHLVVLEDMTATEEQRSLLAIQRDSAFEIIESLHLVSEIEETKNLADLLASESSPASLPFSLRTLVSSTVSAVAKSFKDHNKEVHCTTPHYLPDLFMGNQRAISRVLLCLLGNALENGDGSDIQLKVDLKEKSSAGTCLQFAVEFKSNRTTTNCFESMQEYLIGLQIVEETHRLDGTGLNLAAALIEKMSGTAWVKNMMNCGCTYYFSLNLPESASTDTTVLHDAQLRTDAAGQQTGAGFGLSGIVEKNTSARPRILLAEDNEVDRLTICRILESMNFEVVRVSNGREAVEEFDGSSYDAVLMDILMPEMDGFEATRMIREKERLVGSERTPIIALTSYSLKAIREKCVNVGMDSYLHKPVSSQEITKLFSSATPAGPAPEPVLNDSRIERFPLLDVQESLENMAHNIDMYHEIMDLFTANIESDHQELMAAIRSGVLANIARKAHNIKGMSANIGAKRYGELIQQIQDAALNGDIGEPTRWLHRLSMELPRLQSVIAAINWQKLS